MIEYIGYPTGRMKRFRKQSHGPVIDLLGMRSMTERPSIRLVYTSLFC